MRTGRPPLAEPRVIAVACKVSAADADRIDRARGELIRGSWLYGLIQEALASTAAEARVDTPKGDPEAKLATAHMRAWARGHETHPGEAEDDEQDRSYPPVDGGNSPQVSVPGENGGS